MNYYEKIVIFNPNLEDSAVEEIVEKIKGVIIKQGGEIIKTDNWGRRKLAYELNKQQKGNYVLLLFKAPPSTIAELEKLCGLIDSILKFMCIKITKKKQIASILPTAATEASVQVSSEETGSTAEETAQAVEEAPSSEDK